MKTKHPHLAFGVEPARNKFRLRLARYPAMADAVESLLKTRPDSATLKILDVGAGSGRSLRYLEPRGLLNRLHFTALDNDPHRFRKIYRPDLWHLIAHDISRPFPLSDASFDGVICEQVLEHLPDPAKTLQEIRRVMKDDALAILGVPIFTAPHASLRHHWTIRQQKAGQAMSHPQSFTARSFCRLVQSCGLHVQERRGFRVVSGGRIAPLENHLWWYRLNRRVGRVFPGICTEIQILARKNQPA